jgi:hypothetical protein
MEGDKTKRLIAYTPAEETSPKTYVERAHSGRIIATQQQWLLNRLHRRQAASRPAVRSILSYPPSPPPPQLWISSQGPSKVQASVGQQRKRPFGQEA